MKGRCVMSEVQRYDVLIAGATLLGLGLASVTEGRTVVIERTSGVGAEFAASYRQGTVDGSVTLSTQAAALRKEATDRNITSLEGGGIHWPALVPILHQVIQKNQLEVRFLTRILEVVVDPSGDYLVTLVDASGLSTVKVGRIVDTTSFCDTAPEVAAVYQGKRRLNAVIYRSDELEQQPPQCEGYLAYGGHFASEWVTSIQLTAEDDWSSARNRLLEHWSRRPEALLPWQLVTIADSIDVEMEAGTEYKLDNHWTWRPSAGYRDPIGAFEAGVQSVVEVEVV